MSWHYNPYIIPVIITAVILLILAGIAWQRRAITGAPAVMYLMLILSAWSLLYVFELECSSLAGKLLFVKIEYLFIEIFPLCWLDFVLQYSGRQRWVTPWRLGLAAFFTLAIWASIWTNDSFHTFYLNAWLDIRDSVVMIATRYGPGFWLHTLYQYSIVVLATWFCVQSYFLPVTLYRRQAGILLVSALIPWACNVITITGCSPFPHFDLTPISFAGMGVVVTLGLLRYHLLDLMPVARGAIIESMDDGVVVLDAEQRIVDMNPAALMILGGNRDAFVGLSAATVFDGWPEFTAHLSNSQPSTIEISRDSAESQHFFDVRFTPLADPHGMLTGHFILLRDNSEEKNSEAALRASEERYRVLVDNINVVIFSVDTKGIITFISHVIEQLTGYVQAAVIGHCFDEFIYPDDLAALTASFQRTLSEDNEPAEFRILNNTGQVCWVRSYSRPLHDGETVVGLLGTLTDITELKQAEELREHLEEQLRQAQKMEAVGLLAGGLAHDFNNLLTPIVGYVELARMRLANNEDPLSRYFQHIQTAAERATALTRQLLAVSRKQLLEMQVVDINRVINEFQPILKVSLGDNIDLDIALDNSVDTIKADPAQMQQVLMNLALNARDAMPAGGRLTIATAMTRKDHPYLQRQAVKLPGPLVQLTVSDTGSGLDPAILPRIFDPFFTTKERGKGTGLGLSTVYGIVQQHGGVVLCENQPGQGATFIMLLPAISQRAASPAEDAIPDELLPVRGSVTILVAEDDDDIRTMLSETLISRGYAVLAAEDGLAALHLAEQHPVPIDLLITDIMMPRMNGRELSRRLGEILPDTKILFLSGYSDDIIATADITETGLRFLQKPFTGHTLLQRVGELLQ